MFNDFIHSYTNCIKGMSLETIKPYTETELQPVYSKFWKTHVIDELLKLDLHAENFLNPSVIRSMLVMDLMDCSFNKNTPEYRHKLFDWYVNILRNVYDDDIFSLNKNTPKIYNEYDLISYSYFANNNTNIVILLNKLLQCCYAKFGDIYADNGYEVIGPYYKKNGTYLIYKINNINSKSYDIIYFDDNIVQGTVDMFGHSSLVFKNPKFILLINDDIVYDDSEILREINIIDTYIYNLSDITLGDFIFSRICRLQKIFTEEKINNLHYEITNMCSISIPKERILNNEKLIYLLI